MFFNQPLAATPDDEHANDENRILVLGRTDLRSESIGLRQNASPLPISLRLPVFMLEEIKRMAHKRDIPYQSLIKLFLARSVKRELQEDAT